MDRYKYYNPNPSGHNVGDCSVRAVSKALNQDWQKTFLWLSIYGFNYSDMPSANHVWGKYLRDCNFIRVPVENDTYNVRTFAEEHPKGTFVLVLQGHVVTVVDGFYYDSWDSGNEIIYYYWKKEDKNV